MNPEVAFDVDEPGERLLVAVHAKDVRGAFVVPVDLDDDQVANVLRRTETELINELAFLERLGARDPAPEPEDIVREDDVVDEGRKDSSGEGSASPEDIVRDGDRDPEAEESFRGAGVDREETKYGDLVTDGGEEPRTEWRLVCLECDYREEIEATGHPRDGPPEEVENRVRLHKNTTDASHIVRAEGRPDDRDLDPSLLTDGGRELPDDYEPADRLEPAELRDGETPDLDAHARRNLEQLRLAEREEGEP